MHQAIRLLREIAALKRYDANGARGWATSRLTVNVPVDLLARIDALLAPRRRFRAKETP